MHFLDNYALSCNLKIDEPSLIDSYYPLVQEKFITLDTSFDHPHCKYNHWQKIINILSIVFQKHNIQIVQLGIESDPKLEGTMRTNGFTSYGQLSFILKKSLLNVSSNSFSSHLASALKINSIDLIKDKESTHIAPNWNPSTLQFFGKKDKIFKRRNIDLIPPEDVAHAICKKLNLSLDFRFKTVFVGEKYIDGVEFLETVPDQSVNLASMGTSSIIFRMDSSFNERTLVNQLVQGKATIVTNKEINIDIIKKFKNNITEVVYKIESDNDNASFCESITSLGINLILISNLGERELSEKKLIYMDYGLIMKQPSHRETKKNIKNLTNLKKCYYLSNKYTLSSGKIFSSEIAWKNSVPSNGKFHLCPVIDDLLFWRNLDTFWILELLD